MSTPRYLCRIQIVETNSKQGLATNAADVFYTDKKLFTIGSGSDADFRIKGSGIEGLHIATKLDGQNLFIKSIGAGKTQISSYDLPSEKVVPYKSGEAIRLGDGSKQIIFINLFRRFVEPHEESEAIVREAWERAKEAEASVQASAQALALQQKQTDDLKAEASARAAKMTEQAKEEAAKIQKSALQSRSEIVNKAEQEAQKRIKESEKEVEQALLQVKMKDEEMTRKFVDQAREKAKAIKAEAERDHEEMIQSGQREADMLIANAKKQVTEILERGENEKRQLLDEKKLIQEEIAEASSAQRQAFEGVGSVKAELKKMEDLKAQAQREFDMEKERLRLSLNDIKNELELRVTDKRALESEISESSTYLQNMKTDAETVLHEMEKSIATKRAAEVELSQSQIRIKDLKAEIEKLDAERTGVSDKLNSLKAKELEEQEKLRTKMSVEYEKRKKFEEDWFAKERAREQEEIKRERAAKEKLENERVITQAKAISEKIVPLISLELEAQMTGEDFAVLKPQLETLVDSVVHRSVEEEYQFRRDHWPKVRPKMSRVNVGLAAMAILFFAVAVAAYWPQIQRLQSSNLSSRSPASVTTEDGAGK